MLSSRPEGEGFALVTYYVLMPVHAQYALLMRLHTRDDVAVPVPSVTSPEYSAADSSSASHERSPASAQLERMMSALQQHDAGDAQMEQEAEETNNNGFHLKDWIASVCAHNVHSCTTYIVAQLILTSAAHVYVCVVGMQLQWPMEEEHLQQLETG